MCVGGGELYCCLSNTSMSLYLHTHTHTSIHLYITTRQARLVQHAWTCFWLSSRTLSHTHLHPSHPLLHSPPLHPYKSHIFTLHVRLCCGKGWVAKLKAIRNKCESTCTFNPIHVLNSSLRIRLSDLHPKYAIKCCHCYCLRHTGRYR